MNFLRTMPFAKKEASLMTFKTSLATGLLASSILSMDDKVSLADPFMFFVSEIFLFSFPLTYFCTTDEY